MIIIILPDILCGGVVAAQYYNENEDKLDGLILIESRSNVKLSDDAKVLSIVGSLDGVLKSYEESKKYLPSNFKEVVIDGGNHSGFANYGEQDGDNKATITKEEQQEKTVEAIVEFVKG